MVKFRSGIIGITLLAAAIVSACMEPLAMPEEGRACSTEVSLGVFRGKAAGASTDTLKGCALFTYDTITWSFAMMLTNGGPYTRAPAIKLFRSSLVFAGNTYTIGGTGGLSLWGAMLLGDNKYTLTSGTVTFLAEDRMPSIYAQTYFLQGDLNLTGIDSTGATLSVTGAFQAVCVGDQQGAGVGGSTDPIQKVVKACDRRASGAPATP